MAKYGTDAFWGGSEAAKDSMILMGDWCCYVDAMTARDWAQIVKEPFD